MTKYILAAVMSLFFWVDARTVTAADATPAGQWLVKDKTAHIYILACDSLLWGVISWVSSPDTDKNNPDPSKRNRSVLGMPILLGMRATKPNLWEGDIYNAENGKTYSGSIHLQSSEVLSVKGCVLGILCGGEDWSRLPEQKDAETDNDMCKRIVE